MKSPLEHYDRRKTKYHGFVRAFTVLLTFLLQVVFIVILTAALQRQIFPLYLALELFSIISVYGLVDDERRSKQFWIIVLLLMPGFGFILYYLWGSNHTNSRLQKKMRIAEAAMKAYSNEGDRIIQEFSLVHPNKVQISRYLKREGFPIYKNTSIKYYSMGADMEEDFYQDLRSAKKFIFLDYFIIYKGYWWDRILSILEEKAEQGVEVRILVDDFGSIFLNVAELRERLNARLSRKNLKKGSIKICKFAPVNKRIINLAFNYRDHQKITVIDGKIAYTGGVNLADEYIGKIERFGVWKDSAIRLQGDAVAAMTAIFLVMWQVGNNQEEENIEAYLECKEKDHFDGFVQPFAGGPHRNPTNPPEIVYNFMLNKARDYVYITTPYLVLDQKLIDNITQAARSGVDVRVITPHIYDKWYVYQVNVANYGPLLKSGVKVYEYTPGFMHAKNIVADDECAVCGSINMDYRSLFIHYENGVFFSESQAVLDMKEDFLETLKDCHEITYEEWSHRSAFHKAVQWVCRLTAPLL